MGNVCSTNVDKEKTEKETVNGKNQIEPKQNGHSSSADKPASPMNGDHPAENDQVPKDRMKRIGSANRSRIRLPVDMISMASMEKKAVPSLGPLGLTSEHNSHDPMDYEVVTEEDVQIGLERQATMRRLKMVQTINQELMEAVRRNDVVACDTTLQIGAAVNAMDPTGTPPLHVALKNRNNQIITKLLDAKADVNQIATQTGRTPLLVGCASNVSRDIVQRLLASRADVHAADELGWNVFHVVANSVTSSYYESEQDAVTTAQFFMDNGATQEIGQRAKDGLTPLSIAVANNSKQLIALLQPKTTAMSDSPEMAKRGQWTAKLKDMQADGIWNLPRTDFEQQFEQTEELARGAYADILKGTFRGQTVVYKRVAKVVLKKHPAYAWKCMQREAETLASVRDPGVVSLIGIVHNTDDAPQRDAKARQNNLTSAQVFGLVLEYVDGVSLQSHIKSDLVTISQRLQYSIQIAKIFQNLHRTHGIVHRDLKPANIMVKSRDDSLVLLDFGMARVAGSGAANAASVEESSLVVTADNEGVVDTTHNGAGTLHYSSPEQFDHENKAGVITTKVDIYAFGIMLPELMTGEPWNLTVRQKLQAPQDRLLFPRFEPTGFCTKLESLVRRCLAVVPEERPDFSFVHDFLDTCESEVGSIESV